MIVNPAFAEKYNYYIYDDDIEKAQYYQKAREFLIETPDATCFSVKSRYEIGAKMLEIMHNTKDQKIIDEIKGFKKEIIDEGAMLQLVLGIMRGGMC